MPLKHLRLFNNRTGESYHACRKPGSGNYCCVTLKVQVTCKACLKAPARAKSHIVLPGSRPAR